MILYWQLVLRRKGLFGTLRQKDGYIRFQMLVKTELEKIGLQYTEVKIGKDDHIGNVVLGLLRAMGQSLKKNGLQRMDSKKVSWLRE